MHPTESRERQDDDAAGLASLDPCTSASKQGQRHRDGCYDGESHEGVGDAHQDRVEPPAEVTGYHADDDTEECSAQRDHHPDLKCHTGAPYQSIEHVVLVLHRAQGVTWARWLGGNAETVPGDHVWILPLRRCDQGSRDGNDSEHQHDHTSGQQFWIREHLFDTH